ncbi:MAG: TrkA family potassium uptake protein, partial [Chloroflexi bacterium]|nr:TrkA family potassium uptake protein [Chloroflexota bacterium]
HVPRTIAVINSPHHEQLFDLLGVDVTVSSTQTILAQIQEELPERAPVHVLALRGNREVIEVEVPPESRVVGKALEELDLPPDTTITAVINQDGLLKPLHADTVLESNDEVVALTTADNAESLLEELTREA